MLIWSSYSDELGGTFGNLMETSLGKFIEKFLLSVMFLFCCIKYIFNLEATKLYSEEKSFFWSDLSLYNNTQRFDLVHREDFMRRIEKARKFVPFAESLGTDPYIYTTLWHEMLSVSSIVDTKNV